MTIYAESSAVLRWLFGEEGGEGVERLLQGATKVVCSRLTLLEVRRAAHRASAQGALDEVAVGSALDAFALAASRWAILEVTRDVVERAEGGFPVEPVRTLDAIHLASALVLRRALPDLRVLSTDGRVRANGARMGFEIVPAAVGP